MNRKLLQNTFFCILIILWGLVIIFPAEMYAQADERFEFSQRKMGTDIRIILYASDSVTAHSAANAAYKRIEELDQVLSDYEKNSELSRLNRTAGKGEAIQVSDPLFFVLKKALKVSRLTNGAFDITVGPFVQLWRKSRRTQRLPTKEELKRARKSVGYEYVILNRKGHTVKLLKEGMKLDAGGIGKGYAADEALEVLKEYQITSALVDAGGDIVAGEAPPGKKGWDIGLQILNENSQPVVRIITVCNIAIVTSGDLYQYVKIDGKRYSHIINPRTGLGLTGQSRVTVIAPDGITADSYASATSILGPQKSKKLIQDLSHLEFYFIRNEDGKYSSWESEGFKNLCIQPSEDMEINLSLR